MAVSPRVQSSISIITLPLVKTAFTPSRFMAVRSFILQMRQKSAVTFTKMGLLSATKRASFSSEYDWIGILKLRHFSLINNLICF